jgi:outer membrane protein TolC
MVFFDKKTVMKKFILYTFLTLPLLAKGQTVIKSSEEAMELARKNNRDLRISNERTSIEKENSKVQRASFIPQVKTFSSFDYNYSLPVQLVPAQFLGGKPGEYRTLQFGTKFNWTAGVEASMPLINASLWADSKTTHMNYEASQQNTMNLEFEVMKQVAKGYYLSLLSSKSLAISEQNYKIADSLKQIADHKFKNGLIEPLEYNRILSSYLRAKNDVARNQAILNNNRNSLKYYLGLTQDDSLTLNENLEKIGDPVSLTNQPENYPSVKEKQLLANSSLWNLKRERYKRLPELSLYGRYSVQAQRNEFSFFNFNKPWYTIGVAGLRFEMPLFTGFARTGNIHKLQYRYDIQKKELEREIERAKTEDLELLTNYNNSLIASRNLNESFGLAGQNLKIAFLKYTQGVFSLDQYLNVLNESLSIQSQYLNALADLYTSRTIIELKNNLK